MKKKKIILIAGVVVVGAIAASMLFSNKAPAPTPVQTEPLTAQALRNTIEASGNVESTDTINVYAEVSAPIERVHVKVGDRVSAGQLLAELDDTDLHNTLEQRQIALRTGSEASQQRIKIAEKNYEETKGTLDQGLNTQLNAAKEQVVAAQRALDKAVDDQTINQQRVDQETKDQLLQPKATLSSAEVVLNRTKKAYDDAKKEWKDDYKDLKDELKKLKDSGADKEKIKEAQEALDKYEEDKVIIDENTGATSLKTLREAYEDAELNYNNAKKSLTAAETSAKNAATDKMKTYNKAVEDSQIAYDNAVRALKAMETSIEQSLESAQDTIHSEKIAANTESLQAEIKTLNTNLQKCKITAPAAGTITAVYAVENAVANGLMFVIEDTGGLQVTVRIKEYDIPSVKEGMKAIITADATDKTEYEGVVQKIYPAAIRADAAAGAAAAANNNVEFEAEVLIQTPDSPLRIGMSAKAKIILEEKSNVLAVPYDALTTNEEGKTVIYTVKKQPDDSYQSISLPVTTGLETDFSVEISGDGITAGIPVISEAKSVTPGLPITVTGGAEALADAVSSGSGEAAP
ncbi:efflux RND transporter periplasmic adaptor subunit [Clostridium minihomine]|uniref:efflux RND transporter periplasmic adaptor subunit n=1 Tax=Clostridium minihomine TaxID=2045012 RepID=UPI000C783B08|nr:efflux RND transporter periplasmic adaptor subunit [Clostridium minihomine]